jgi:hypothetical protein
MGVLLLLLAACTTDPSQDGLPDPNLLTALEVEPAELTLVTGPDGSETAQFTAWATLEDGSRVELEVADWTVSNGSAGSVDEQGLFTPADDNGGITWVTAEYANTWASATVTVVYHEQLVEGGADPALFTGSPQPLEPSPWLYPEHGVRLPRGTPSIHFQWEDQAADAYRLHFESEVSDIEVFTTEPGWESQAALWQVIAATNAAGSVAVTLSASAGGQLFEAAPLELLVNRMDTRGTIYYWTSTLEGVSRITEEHENESWWAKDDMDGHCVGCHAISTGAEPLLAYSAHPPGSEYNPQNPGTEWLEVRRLSDPESSYLTMAEGLSADFKSFSPDGEYLLGTIGCQLLLFDPRGGGLIQDVTPWDEAAGASHCVSQAEWSPDGDQVALVVTDDLILSWRIDEGAIYLMDHIGGGSFGDPELLVDPDALFDDTEHIAYYPAWSPDGAWLAFNTSTGNSYDDEDAELWVVSPEGGAPIPLDRANMGAGLTNSWPRWSPLPDDDILWLTFSSRRDYGYTAVRGWPQVWVSAFDPALAEQGLDPSSPAFWLVGQDPYENNHVPVWVE